MKNKLMPVLILLTILIAAGCKGKSAKNGNANEADTISVPDTGFTGIKQYMSGTRLFKEVTFKNSVMEGLSKFFYADGRVRITYWYENNLRQDSSRWYYQEGQLFRTTPYKNDTVDGIQKQYFRTGQLRAMIGFSKGFRIPYIEEFTKEGKKITSYPELIVGTDDQYKSKGIYRITLQLSDKSEKVRFYRGGLSNGVFDTTQCKKIKAVKGLATINLKKSGKTEDTSVSFIAEILTAHGNNLIVERKISLPYNDLK